MSHLKWLWVVRASCGDHMDEMLIIDEQRYEREIVYSEIFRSWAEEKCTSSDGTKWNILKIASLLHRVENAKWRTALCEWALTKGQRVVVFCLLLVLFCWQLYYMAFGYSETVTSSYRLTILRVTSMDSVWFNSSGLFLFENSSIRSKKFLEMSESYFLHSPVSLGFQINQDWFCLSTRCGFKWCCFWPFHHWSSPWQWLIGNEKCWYYLVVPTWYQLGSAII